MTVSNAVESINLAEAGQGGGDHTFVICNFLYQLNSNLPDKQEGNEHAE